jgi:hypothetical protein
MTYIASFAATEQQFTPPAQPSACTSIQDKHRGALFFSSVSLSEWTCNNNGNFEGFLLITRLLSLLSLQQ